MRLIDRYLFGQLLGPCLLATAALTGVAVLSQSLSAIGVLVDHRQSWMVFGKIVVLAVPQLIVLILPVALLAAGLIVLNRLRTEQEIVTCFSAGMSRWRVIRPAIQLATAATLISLVLTLWVQPWAFRALRDTLDQLRTDLVTTMIKPGQFTHPVAGLTVYAQSVDDDGAIHNLFINRGAGKGHDVTITAQEGRLERQGGVAMLIMRHGANQEFSQSGVLNFLSFDQYVFDLRPFMSLDRSVHYKLSDRYLHELFFPDSRQAWERANIAKMLAEGHSRLATPLYNIAFMAMALAAVIGGGFSRMGYGGRIAMAATAALFIRTLGFAMQAAAASTPLLNILQYLVPVIAVVGSCLILFDDWRARGAAGTVAGREPR